jgi:AcrR family transcriptional regulator
MSHAVQTDLRIRRTHHFLQEAMIELITEKGVDAITVGDITERAMINRATFYRHYQDKYDLVARIFEETADSLVEQIKPLRKDSDRVEKEENFLEIWIQFFEHVAQHARMYRAMRCSTIIRSNGVDQLKLPMKKMAYLRPENHRGKEEHFLLIDRGGLHKWCAECANSGKS